VKKIKLHWWILLGMVVGATAGALLHYVYPDELVRATAAYHAFDGLASIFLKLLRMIVVPLVFFSLITGMLGMGDLSRFGRLGLKTFALYVVTSLMAILTGLFLVNLIRPGLGLGLEIPTTPVEREVPESFWEVLVNMVPENVVEAAADFDLIGVIVFALFFGAFTLTLSDGPRKRALIDLMQSAADVMMKMTGFVIALAPIGIAALIARMVSTTGVGVFLDLRWYILTVLLALGLHVTLTLPCLVYVATRTNPYRFLRAMSPALLTGFSTASSSGTLGVTLERAEHGAGISNRVASFVLPIGATVNMDGTALYEIVTVLFIAQIHAGVDPSFSLSLGQQVLIVFLGLTVSVGAAGIPHAGLVMMVIILEAVGLPIEYTGLIWAVDRLLDMCRTATNIASDSCVTYIVASSEGELDRSTLAART
jgi:proton glutamate symport protein